MVCVCTLVRFVNSITTLPCPLPNSSSMPSACSIHRAPVTHCYIEHILGSWGGRSPGWQMGRRAGRMVGRHGQAGGWTGGRMVWGKSLMGIICVSSSMHGSRMGCHNLVHLNCRRSIGPGRGKHMAGRKLLCSHGGEHSLDATQAKVFEYGHGVCLHSLCTPCSRPVTTCSPCSRPV
jgi:hypothetical protein